MKSYLPTYHWFFCVSLVSLMPLLPARAAQISFNPGDIPGGLPGGLDVPFLLLANPANGARNVALNTPVTFTFLTSMAPVQKVDWSDNVVAGNFTYAWSADGKTLTSTYAGNFPVNSTISWTLDPTVFKSVSGTELLPFNNSGTFTTGSGQSDPNDPCDGGSTNANIGTLSLFKSVRYVQTSAAGPVIEDESGAIFGASVAPTAANPVTQATLQLPNGTSRQFDSIFGRFLLTEDFPTQAALDAAYPAGLYKVTLTLASGTADFNLSFPATGGPPTPQITNFPQTQSFDPTTDFLVQWGAFTGATEGDSISFSMFDDTTNFYAPDPCVPRLLPNTATSITVPGNTFGAGDEYDASLTFNRTGTFDTNSVPGMYAFSGYSKVTSFKPRGSGTTDPKPIIENLVRLPNGNVQFQVMGTAASMVVEASSDLKTWTTIFTAPSPSGSLDVMDSQAKSEAHRFYRATAR